MRNKSGIIFLLAITLIVGYFIVKDSPFIEDSVNASIDTGSIILDNDYNKPFAMINGKEVFLRKSYSQNLKEESNKYKEEFLNEYENILISEGVSKKDIGLFIDEKMENYIKEKLIEELEFELILQDATDKKMISYLEKDNLLNEDNAEQLNNFIDEYKLSITEENQISDKDINDFIKDNDSNLIWHKRISRNYIGKKNAKRGNNKTSIVNNDDHQVYEGFNYRLPKISQYENINHGKINENVISMNEGEVTGLIPIGDYGVEYTIAYLSEKDSNPHNHLDQIENLMDDLYFHDHMKDLFYFNNIEILVNKMDLNFPTTDIKDAVSYDINFLDKDMDFEDKKDILEGFIKNTVSKSKDVEIKNIDISEDNTLLYIDEPIKKYANINIDLQLKFINNLRREERMAISDFLNEEFFKGIESLPVKNEFSFNEYVNDFSVSFYKIDGEKDQSTGFGHTPARSEFLRSPEPLHEKEEYVLEQVYNLVKSYSDGSTEVGLENFGLVDDKIFIKIYLGHEDEAKYKEAGNNLKEDLEKLFKEDDKFKVYKEDLNIEKIQLEMFSNWYDEDLFKF